MFVHQILMLSWCKILDFFYNTSLRMIYQGFNKRIRAGSIIFYVYIQAIFPFSQQQENISYLWKCVPIGLQANFYYLKRVNHDGFCESRSQSSNGKCLEKMKSINTFKQVTVCHRVKHSIPYIVEPQLWWDWENLHKRTIYHYTQLQFSIRCWQFTKKKLQKP